jgi:hypothetical protein
MIRSLNEPRGEAATWGCDGGASNCGIAGTSILGGGSGGGGGGLNCEPPGGMNCCAEAAQGASSTEARQMMIGILMATMS